MALAVVAAGAAGNGGVCDAGCREDADEKAQELELLSHVVVGRSSPKRDR
jgi:hypothetical protein